MYPSGNYSPVSEPYSPTRQQYVCNGPPISAAPEAAIIHRISSSKDERVPACIHPLSTHVRPAGQHDEHFGSLLGYQSPASRYSPTHGGMTFSPPHLERPIAAEYQCNTFAPVIQQAAPSVAPSSRHVAGSLELRAQPAGEVSAASQCYRFESPGPVCHDRQCGVHVEQEEPRCSKQGQPVPTSPATAGQDPVFPHYAQTPRFDSDSRDSPSQNYQFQQGDCSAENTRLKVNTREKNAAQTGTSGWHTRHGQDSSSVTTEVQRLQGTPTERASEGSSKFAEVLGGHRQSASILPVFTEDGEIINHGQRFGGEQPEASRRAQLERPGRKPLWSGEETNHANYSLLFLCLQAFEERALALSAGLRLSSSNVFTCFPCRQVPQRTDRGSVGGYTEWPAKVEGPPR